MLQTYVFWASLFLPGFVVIRAFAPAELERGLLSAVALGYAGSFCVLSPFALLCYLLHLPVGVMSCAVAACVALALFWLLHSGGRGSLVRLGACEPSLPWVLLSALLVLDARVGGWLDGDATYHVGRIRDLLDHGFSNRDIYLAKPYFAYAYHTNLVHALYAVATQLTRSDLLPVWFASLPWAKLVIAGGHYHLAHVLFQKRWAAWLVALGVLVARAGETYSVYPNLLAVGWLLPLLLAFGFAAHEPDADRTRTLLGIGLGSVLLGEVHSLYIAFACIALLPLLLLRAVVLRAQRKPARFFALCIVCLLAGAPFAWIARYGGQPSDKQLRAALADSPTLPALPTLPSREPSRDKSDKPKSPALQAGGGHLEKQLAKRADDRRALPLASAGGATFLLLGLASLGFCLLRPEPFRPRMLALSAAAVSLLVIPFEPSLCALLMAHGFPGFGVARMVTLSSSLLFVAIGGALAALVERLTSRTALHNTVIALSTLAATQLLGHAPRSFAEHLHNAFEDETQRHSLLDQHRARRALLKAYVPAGTTVLTTLRDARYLVMLHDVHVIAADRGHARIPDLDVRQKSVELMTAARLDWPLRAELLRHYRARFVVYRDKHASRFSWTRAHGEYLGQAGGLHLVRLREDF
jgi:hypothetical protein